MNATFKIIMLDGEEYIKLLGQIKLNHNEIEHLKASLSKGEIEAVEDDLNMESPEPSDEKA